MMTETELRMLKVALNARLDRLLTETMKPNCDDSITGFNECWDRVGEFFDEQITKVAK